MLPKSKNPKNEKWLRICSNCQNLSDVFRKYLLAGDKEEAKKIYKSGKVQIYQPYQIYSDKFYPIHCATQSGNLETVKWLVSEKCNPRVKDSKQRSALALAASKGYLNICKFFIFRGLSKVEEIQDVTALQKMLRSSLIEIQKKEINLSLSKYGNVTKSKESTIIPQTKLEEEEHLRMALEMSESVNDHEVPVVEVTGVDDDGTTDSECLICFANSVDSVLVPCGHMCCCQECAEAMKECPVCRQTISQIVKTYKT